MKKNTIPALAILMATSMFFMQGCRDILVIEYVQCPVCQPDGSSDDQENQGGSGLGNNLVMDPGMCGKSGQSVPVTDGQPSMLIEGLTVGGSEA